MANKQISLSTKEKVKRLTSLVKDAEDLEFNPKLIKKFKKQLQDQEDILQKEAEKRKAQLKEYKDMQKLNEDLKKKKQKKESLIKEGEIVVLNEGEQREGMSSNTIRYHRAL